MNKLKLYLVLICIFLMSCFTSMAAEVSPSFELSVTADSVKVNDSVYLLVDLKNNVGFGAVQFRITYDKDKLIPESATPGELIPSDAISLVNSEIEGQINFSAIRIENITGSGTVLVSKFKALNPGNIKFDFNLQAYAESNGTNLSATTSNNAELIIVSDEDESLPGDDSSIEDGTQTEGNTGGSTSGGSTSGGSTSGGISSGGSSSGGSYGGGSSGGGSSGTVAANKKEEASENEEIKTEPEKNAEVAFSDVPKSHWAYNQIYKASQMGLFSGTDKNTFSPDLPMTRAMFVTVLYRYAGSPESAGDDTHIFTEFTDLEDSWYLDAVLWAKANNIVSGTGDGKFSPHKYITRGEMATILCRYKDGKCIDPSSINGFKDSMDIPDWGKESIAWAVERGLIMGRQGSIIAFSDNATRAETAVIFTRFLNIK